MRLRIISGEFKGRLIKAPDSKFTRPTTDRVRETIFNILNNIIDFNEMKVLDLYAGSGSLGFESLSRGAATIDFVEKNFPVYNNLNENIKALEVENKCKIHKTSAVNYVSKEIGSKYDLILADPPFFEFDIYEVVKSILSNNILAPSGLMIIERSIQTLEKDKEGLGIEPFKRIGDTCLYKLNKAV